jgi:hypothetical protein
MAGKIQTIHDEHAAFVPRLEEIQQLAEAAGTIPTHEFRTRTLAVHGFLAHELMPHAAAEGRIIAPLTADDEGDRALGREMTMCHVEVAKRTDELERLIVGLSDAPMTPVQTRSFQRVLFGIHALLSAHFAQAEDVVESVLEERLSAEDREAVFDRIDRIADEVRALYE